MESTYKELHERPDFARNLKKGDVLQHFNEETGFISYVKFIKFHEDKNDYYLFYGKRLNGDKKGLVQRNFYTHKFMHLVRNPLPCASV